MLGIEPSSWQANKDQPPLTPGETTALDWSHRLSIDLIRQHTKTDDIPGTTDELLALYRAAAVGAAEQYTGMLLAEQRVVIEPIEGPPSSGSHRHYDPYYYLHGPPYGGLHPTKQTYRVRLQYTVSDGIVYLYGGMHPGDNTKLQVKPGTRTIHVPVRYGWIDTSNCCNPCSSHHLNGGMMAAYRAGFSSPEVVPTGVVLGCLQYIAWVLQHPGDEILTVRNRRDARSEGAQGTNNIAIASGALETWRILDVDTI